MDLLVPCKNHAFLENRIILIAQFVNMFLKKYGKIVDLHKDDWYSTVVDGLAFVITPAQNLMSALHASVMLGGIMERLNVGFVTTVSGRWPRSLPMERNQTYTVWLQEHAHEARIISFDHVIDSSERIQDAISHLRAEGAELVIMLYGAFTGDDVSTRIAETLKLPLILWAPREPDAHGGRLLSNALVAMTMNNASLRRLGYRAQTVYGGLESETAKQAILTYIRAYAAIKKLRGSTLGLFGYRPTAFYNSAFDEGLIRRTFGVAIEETDLKVVFDRMQQVDEEALAQDMAFIQNSYCLGDDFIEEYRINHSRLYLTLKQLMQEQNYAYGVIKCWPEMGNLNSVPCAVLGRLADEGYSIACEGDVDVSLSMAVQNALTGTANFITDLIDINEQENYLTFWHCGNAAPSLHHCQCDVKLCDHPLYNKGSAFRAVLKEGNVTISRFCNIDGTYKLFLIKGTAIPTTMYTPGCMINVKIEQPVRNVIDGIIREAVPHHYSIVWEDVEKEMRMIADILGIEVIFL